MRILVTGGTGYIGSHTYVELINKGYDVVIIDNLCNSNIEVLNSLHEITGVSPEFYNIDLSNKLLVDDFFRSKPNFDAIIHFAALKAVGESVQKPLAYYENNLFGLINILTNMEKHKIKGMVFSSSCTVYGQPDHLPVLESTPRKTAESPYGNTKSIAEDIIRDLCKSSPSTQIIALRYFNPIGAHPSALIGELPLGTPNNLVPFITQTAAGIRDCLSVFGSDYNTPDGTAIRDYIDVVDLAKAHVVAIDRIVNNKQEFNFEYFNIGTGVGKSVLEIITAFEKSTGVKLNYKIVARREGDIEKIWADTSISNKKLNWEAKTPLEESLLNSWNWEKRIRNI